MLSRYAESACRALVALALLAGVACGTSPPDPAAALARWTAKCAERTPADGSVEVRRVLEAAGEGFVLIDARTPAERAVSGIPGALALDAFDSRSPQVAGATIVVYCTVGCRSAAVAKRLRREGVSAANLTGGVLAWAWAGGAFVDPEGNETRRVHVFGERWNLLPPGYEPVY